MRLKGRRHSARRKRQSDFSRTVSFQKQLAVGRFTLPVAMLISAIFWLLADALLPETNSQWSNAAAWTLLNEASTPSWIRSFCGFLLYSFIGYLLIELNNTFAIIRMRASVQTAIYFLLIAACPSIQRVYSGDFSAAMFLVALFFLFKCYHRVRPEAHLFHSFVFLGIASLFFRQALLFIPLFWIGAYNFKALQLRSFCASLIGLALPYSLLLGYGFYSGNVWAVLHPFVAETFFYPIDWSFTTWLLATLSYLFVLFAASVGHIFMAGYEDKIRTRSYLHFLVLINAFLFVFIALQPATAIQMLPFLLIGSSILAGHLFALTNSRCSNLFFVAMCVLLILLFGYNVWTLL